jgi:hypothetical protein
MKLFIEASGQVKSLRESYDWKEHFSLYVLIFFFNLILNF